MTQGGDQVCDLGGGGKKEDLQRLVLKTPLGRTFSGGL